MKKLSLFVGTMGGAMAGYLLSNKKLREQLSKAKDPEAAAKLLGKQLQKDGKNFAKQVHTFVKSEEVQDNLQKAKKYAKEKTDEAQAKLKTMVKTGQKKATAAAKTGAKKVQKTAKKAVKSAKKTATKSAKRVKAKTRRLS